MSALPMVLMGVGTAVQVAGTAVQVAGQLQKGQAEADTAKYNSRVAQLQATQVRRASEFEIQKLKREKSQHLARQRVVTAKSGLELSGSPLEVLIDSATQFELDIAAERYNTMSQISNLQFESDYQKRLAKAAKTSSYLAAGGTLLTGLAGMYGMKSVKTPTPSTSTYTGMGSLSYGTSGYKPKSIWPF